MPVKRPHRKSRNGCTQCRQRRVKCDEKFPCCSACDKREESCHYFPRLLRTPSNTGPSVSASPSPPQIMPCTTPLHTSGAPSESAQSRSTSCTAPREAREPTSRIRELVLMHHWCTSTCNSFTKEIGDKIRDYAIEETLRQEYLMEAILALTSLHIATEAKTSTAVGDSVSEALHYQNQAVAGLRSALGTLSQGNCDAVFLTSIIIMICIMVSPLLQSRCNHQFQTTAEMMLKLVDFQEGIVSILDVSRAWVRQGPLGFIIDPKTGVTVPPVNLPLRDTRDLNNAKNAAQLRLVCEHAIGTIEKAMLEGRSRLVFSWIAKVKPEFLELLREGDNVALAIFMQWGVLLDQFDDLWWARLSGRHLVDEISCALDAAGDEWISITKWCRAQVRLDVEALSTPNSSFCQLGI